MRRWLKRVGLSVLVLVLLALAALPFIVGVRPILGPRARALTDRGVTSAGALKAAEIIKSRRVMSAMERSC